MKQKLTIAQATVLRVRDNEGADRVILVESAKIKYPAVAVGMQREQVKPLHAAYWTTV